MRRVILIAIAAAVSGSSAAAQPVAKLTEDLRLDATAEDFPSVNSVTIGPRGQILVGVARDNQLRVYDSTGKKVGVIGRTGSGPGEFRSMAGIGWIADTFWVHDYQLRRNTFVGPDLKVLRTVPAVEAQMTGTATQERGFPGVRFMPWGLYPDGSALGDGSFTKSAVNTDPWTRYVGIQSPTGTITRITTAPAFEDPRWHMFYGGFYRSVPFTIWPMVAYALDGSRYGFLVVDNTTRDGGVVTASSYRRNGTVEFVKKIPFTGKPVPGRVRDSMLAAFLPPPGRAIEGPAELPKRFQEIARERSPSFYPPVEGFLLGLDNTTWILLPIEDEVRPANVLDGKGNVIGTVVPPKRTRIRHGTASYIWTTQRDDDDLISVVRYRISWPGRE